MGTKHHSDRAPWQNAQNLTDNQESQYDITSSSSSPKGAQVLSQIMPNPPIFWRLQLGCLVLCVFPWLKSGPS